MKKIFIFTIVLAGLFATAITSCSKDANGSIETGNTSYSDGEYSGDQLSLTVDEKVALDSKATIKVSNDNSFKTIISDFPDAKSDVTISGMMDDNSVATGSFEISGGAKYVYTLYFNGFYGKVQLVIVCKKVE